MYHDYQNNNKFGRKPKIQLKKERRRCRSHLNNKIFSENYGLLNVFSKPMGTLSIMTIR